MCCQTSLRWVLCFFAVRRNWGNAVICHQHVRKEKLSTRLQRRELIFFCFWAKTTYLQLSAPCSNTEARRRKHWNPSKWSKPSKERNSFKMILETLWSSVKIFAVLHLSGWINATMFTNDHQRNKAQICTDSRGKLNMGIRLEQNLSSTRFEGDLTC